MLVDSIMLGLSVIILALHTVSAEWLEGEANSHNRHDNVQHSTDVDGRCRRCVGRRSNSSTDKTHNSVASNCNSIARSSMGGW